MIPVIKNMTKETQPIKTDEKKNVETKKTTKTPTTTERKEGKERKCHKMIKSWA